MKLLKICMTFLFVLLLAFCSCNENPPIDSLAAEMVAGFQSNRNKTVADVQTIISNATNTEQSVIFVHVAGTSSVWGFGDYADFVIEYSNRDRTNDTLFHFLDCTPICNYYGPLRKIDGWRDLIADNEGGALIHGEGELVWLLNGRVLHVQSIRDFSSTAELVAVTDDLFSG